MDNKETRRTELAYIRQLKSEYDLNNPREVLAVFRELQTNGFKFTTKEGIEFDDEIFERAQEYKHQGYRESSPSKGTIVRDQVYEKDLEIEVRRQLQKRERIRRTIVISCLSTAVICIGVFLYYYYVAERTQREYEQLAEMIDEDAPTGAVSEITNSQMVVAEDGTIETVTLSVLDKYEELYHTNPNLIGWLKIGDTVIDYPVTQTSESDYYLNHNFYEKTDSNGCIFMDPDCNVINRSDNLILYGHHMKSGNMFGNLDRYSKYEYYLEHPTIQFDTIYEEGTYQVMYVFRSRIYNEDEVTFKYYQFINANSAEEFDSYMNEMAAMSLYDTGVKAGYGDELITLSTCDYQEKNGRFVVVARRV